ncbi:MAG: hypothetical protein JXM73_15920 [Anaerolineae bacterium]|nr:hypothetical protein [Anaerolineae bacterium]
MEIKTLYFDKPGPANTDATLRAARERAEALGIKQIVLASSHGYTARRAAELLAGLDVKLIAVSLSAAFADQGWPMSASERAAVEALGVTVLTAIHALGDDVSEAFMDNPPNKIVRETLYRFCQGLKVAVEVAIMAADAGLLDTTHDAIAIAGTGDGADTAIVLRPACALHFKKLHVYEILAKPR